MWRSPRDFSVWTLLLSSETLVEFRDIGWVQRLWLSSENLVEFRDFGWSVRWLAGNAFVRIDKTWTFMDSKWFTQCWTRNKAGRERRGGRREWKNEKVVKKKRKMENSIVDRSVWFLDASSHLYKRVCPSVRRSVHRSVRRSVGPSVTLCIFQCFNEF